MRYLLTSFLCVFTLSLTAQEACPNPYDGNGDGNVSIGDFLEMLAVFGDTDIDSDGVWDSLDDCVDLAACNYANDPSEPCTYIDVLGVCGGGCEGDGDDDGICDSEDDCVGVLDECGVCNGPGPTEITIESITILYDSLYAEQIDDWLVFEIGADTVFNYACEPVFTGCGDLVSHEGYDYSTVLIGEQCWFSENLRYLPAISPTSASSTTSPYYYVWGYEGTDVAAAQATTYYEMYGVLYNWPAVMEIGICPSGWHIPSDGEWQTMEVSLGMSEAEASSQGPRGSPVGDYMKSTSGWNDGGNGSNSSGFNGLPGGYTIGGFYGFNESCYLWSSSEFGIDSWIRILDSNYDDVLRYAYTQSHGYSARCVIDYLDGCGVFNGDNSTCADNCGVPNGPGAVFECGCSDMPDGDCDCEGNQVDECGVCGGDNSTCADDCGVPNGDNSTCFTTCGDDIEHDAYDYSTVLIGEQCWFSENCRYLPVVSSSSAGSEISPYYYVYGYGGTTVEEAKATSNYATYGVLYNWPAVMTEGICPSGWHIPSDGEWQTMEMSLGMSEADAASEGWRGTDEGYQMKSTSGWNGGGNGSNSSGFTGLPGGYRSGGFGGNGYDGYWWSASESDYNNGSYSWTRKLYSGSDSVIRNDTTRDEGFSARCVQD